MRALSGMVTSLFDGPYALLAKWIVIALLLASFGAWSYTKGIHREADRRDALELKQAKIDAEDYAALTSYGVIKAREADANQAEADKYHQNWKEARDAAKRAGTPLAVADCSAAAPVAAAAGSGLKDPAPGLRLRLTWEFVGLWDSAYTASDGKPLFGDTARAEKAAAGPGAASPYGPDELLDRHEANVAKYDACRRQLGALVKTIDGLEQQWAEQHR